MSARALGTPPCASTARTTGVKSMPSQHMLRGQPWGMLHVRLYAHPMPSARQLCTVMCAMASYQAYITPDGPCIRSATAHTSSRDTWSKHLKTSTERRLKG
eukprot:5640155-Alexandrium_andersonii.AAC.1